MSGRPKQQIRDSIRYHGWAGLLALLVLATSLLGCAPTVTRPAGSNELTAIKALAVLPPEYPSDIPRERVDAFRVALESQLMSSGYLLVEAAQIVRFCSSPACPERKRIAAELGVDTFLAVKLKKQQRSNFLAGYYNALAGELILSDSQGHELLLVSHAESERGGLLFSSGQLLQGIQSTVSNAQIDSFSVLAERFAAETIIKLPPPAAASNGTQGAEAIKIDSVDIKAIRSDLYKVCIVGTPHMTAYVRQAFLKTSLSETTPGQYCGTLLVDNQQKLAPINVELRSSFGRVSERSVVLKGQSDCELFTTADVKQEGSRFIVSLRCKAKEAEGPSCGLEPGDCKDYQLIIYRKNSSSNEYQSIARVKLGQVRNLPASDQEQYLAATYVGDVPLGLPMELTKNTEATNDPDL